MLKIRTAKDEDYIHIRDFYYSLIDAMEEAEYKPGWERDIWLDVLGGNLPAEKAYTKMGFIY